MSTWLSLSVWLAPRRWCFPVPSPRGSQLPKDGWAPSPTGEVFAALGTGGSTSVEPQFSHLWWENVWVEALGCFLHLLRPEMWGLDFSRVPHDGCCPECHGPPHRLLLQLASLRRGPPPEGKPSCAPTWQCSPHLPPPSCAVRAALTTVAHVLICRSREKVLSTPEGTSASPGS